MTTRTALGCKGPRDLAWEDRAGLGVSLYWIPLGAGARSVRFNGIVYEAIAAALDHRSRRDLLHSVLRVDRPDGRYWVEMTPVPDAHGDARGVVAGGAVGLRVLGRMRPFRYEIRRWRDGIVSDLSFAVAGPVRVADDAAAAERVFNLLPQVPTPVWGRDELRTGDMWTCNSVISWTLAAAGIDMDAIAIPPRARAPGWTAGREIARRHGTLLSPCGPPPAAQLPARSA